MTCTALTYIQSAQFLQNGTRQHVLTSMRVHPVYWVILWIQAVLEMELGVLQHPLYDILYVDSLGHMP